jgi:asparagine synthase (glutamine-hydrolysing)
MCGIAGKVDFDGNVDEAVLNSMSEVMEHRGPDERGVYVGQGVGLAMQRLAIIDVAGGQQPIFNEDRTVAVVLNGEIYNFEEIRAELSDRGHRFATRSDTEVLVHLYEEMGADLVQKLRGMFAFAIWDEPRQTLLLARDRVGKKPLFWSRDGSRVWFASEIRALLKDPAVSREINPEAIDAYLGLQYIPHPMSAFRHIHKVPPACTLTISERGVETKRYWELDYTRKLEPMPVPEIEERVRALIREATRVRLMSEVPLGGFLSGGIDSSVVVAAMAEQSTSPVKTFSISFADDEFNEAQFARIVAEQFGTDHHEFRVDPDALTIMPKLARHYGEPFADPSAIPSFYLAELTSQHVTVALNGDGGDESFAGYRRYVGNDMARRLNWLPRPFQKLAPKVANVIGDGPADNSTRTRIGRLSRSLAMEPWERYASWMSAFDRERRGRLETGEFRAGLNGSAPEQAIAEAWMASNAPGRVDRMQDVDVATYLPGDLLVKMDIATMAHSVEARSPFLDHELMEFAAALPQELKFRGGRGKLILKSAARGWIPDQILDRPKMGFGVPLRRWFREDLRDLPSEILLDPGARERGYFDSGEVERLISEHRSSKADHSLRLWTLLQLEMWHREVVEA